MLKWVKRVKTLISDTVNYFNKGWGLVPSPTNTRKSTFVYFVFDILSVNLMENLLKNC